jgi:sugar phosphate isomerase/epimerase
MYRIGVSTPCQIDEEMFRLYKEAGIAQMEVSVNKEQSEALDFDKLLEWSKKYGVELYSFHLPFMPFNDIDISRPDLAEKSVEYLKGYIDKGAKIGIDKYIIHPSGEPIAEEDRATRMEIAKNSLSILAEYAKERGAVICVENLPRTCLGRDSSDIIELLSAHPDLRCCFDTNHLLYEDPVDFAYKVGKKIATTHVSDCDFTNEKHWFPGVGLIRWHDLYRALEEVGYEGVWMYELGFGDRTPEDFIRNAHEIAEGKPITV